MSETRPARAKMPSNRSWLSSVFSGTRPGERGLEGVDVVDALAGVGAFAEQVLVDVGDRGRVRIDAAGPEKTRWKSEPSRPIGSDGVTRGCSTRVALDHAAGRRIEARPVERMRHLADQPLGRVARQPRVGVERDHVADAGRHGGAAAGRR